MAENTTNYQCPACTGPLRFDSASGKLCCDYCGSTYDVAQVEALYGEKQAQADKAQGGLVDDQAGHVQGEVDQDDAHGVGHDVGEDDAHGAGAAGPGGLHVLLLAQVEHLRAHQAHVVGEVGQGHGHDEHRDAGA